MTRSMPEEHEAAAAVPELGDAIKRFHDGSFSPEEFTAAFLRSALYCERGERPGFVAGGERGKGFVLAFSSTEELARYCARFPERYGEGVDWFSASGDDLVNLLPDGYGIALDVAGAHPVALPAAALRRRLVLRTRRREAANVAMG